MGGSHSKSKPQPEHWSVETNNYMDNAGVVATNNNAAGISAFQVGSGGTEDPAFGCAKNFTATYHCGSNTTDSRSISIDPEAYGKVALFNCEPEVLKCLGGTLYIEDDGNATMKNSSGSVIWTSNTSKTGLALPQYSAANTKYKRNYIKAGEFLRVNEIVGSPSGNCYLQCGSWGGKLNLMIGYQVLACNKPGEEPPPNSYGEYGFVSSTQGATYKMEQGVQNHNLQGTVGYSDNNMIAHKYPNKLLSLGTDYISLGNYNTPSAPNVAHLENTDLDSCKKACNDRDDCYGIVHSGGNNCWLKDKSNYPGNLKRVPDSNAQLYVRKMKVTNNESCSKNVLPTYGQNYVNMRQGSNMTKDMLCQLGEATSEQLKVVAQKEKVLLEQLSNVSAQIKKLNGQNARLDNDMLKALKQMEDESVLYEETLKKIREEKKRLQNTDAMEDSSNLDMISSNMHFMAWTAVAALAVGAGIKATR